MNTTPEILLSLVLFVSVTTITPGGATALATASGAQFGFRRSIPLIAGIAFGLASLAAIAGAGLAGLFQAMPSLQLVMKLVGSLYLLWLAWKVAMAGRPNLGAQGAQTPTSFLAGALLLWLNPKGWAMTMGAAASFAALTASPLSLSALLGTVFGLCATVSLSLWCLAGLFLGRKLRTERHWRIANFTLGLLLVASIVPIWLE